MSNFPFISNSVLRVNLDRAFDHILDLLTLLESDLYKEKDKKILASSLRKTIVIHTASIIEALLLWKLKKKVKDDMVELSDEWKYIDIKIIHRLNELEYIIVGKRKKETRQFNQLDFVRIIDLCKKHKIINNNLAKDSHHVRKLRNRLHISGLTAMEKDYTKSDLNFVFNVAKSAKEIVSK